MFVRSSEKSLVKAGYFFCLDAKEVSKRKNQDYGSRWRTSRRSAKSSELASLKQQSFLNASLLLPFAVEPKVDHSFLRNDAVAKIVISNNFLEPRSVMIGNASTLSWEQGKRKSGQGNLSPGHGWMRVCRAVDRMRMTGCLCCPSSCSWLPRHRSGA